MSGDPDVSSAPWKSRAGNVSGGHSENFRSSAFQNHHGHVKAGDLDSSDRVARMGRKNHHNMWKGLNTWRIELAPLRAVDQPAGRSLHAEHFQLKVPIP